MRYHGYVSMRYHGYVRCMQSVVIPTLPARRRTLNCSYRTLGGVFLRGGCCFSEVGSLG
jgi:hypothetical protein